MFLITSTSALVLPLVPSSEVRGQCQLKSLVGDLCFCSRVLEQDGRLLTCWDCGDVGLCCTAWCQIEQRTVGLIDKMCLKLGELGHQVPQNQAQIKMRCETTKPDAMQEDRTCWSHHLHKIKHSIASFHFQTRLTWFVRECRGFAVSQSSQKPQSEGDANERKSCSKGVKPAVRPGHFVRTAAWIWETSTSFYALVDRLSHQTIPISHCTSLFVTL